jgi:hypothetical protein
MRKFFVGMPEPTYAARAGPAFISVHRLARRRSDFDVGEWVMDSGAFSTIGKHGGYPDGPAEYAAQVRRWSSCGRLLAAVTQDYMCEPWMLRRTGMTVRRHQHLTVERYDAIRRAGTAGVYLMPVLQGYDPEEYARHVAMYGRRLARGAWVGVGSICKRNGKPEEVEGVLRAVLAARPDLRLHGFGIKLTALRSREVRRMLWSADSAAWSFSARINGRDPNDPREAERFARRACELSGIKFKEAR